MDDTATRKERCQRHEYLRFSVCCHSRQWGLIYAKPEVYNDISRWLNKVYGTYTIGYLEHGPQSASRLRQSRESRILIGCPPPDAFANTRYYPPRQPNLAFSDD